MAGETVGLIAVAVVTAAGVAASPAFVATGINLADYSAMAGVTMLGMVAKAGFAASAGAKFDFRALAFSCLGAPLVGATVLAMCRWQNLDDGMTVPLAMGMGYLGREGVDSMMKLVQAVLFRNKP